VPFDKLRAHPDWPLLNRFHSWLTGPARRQLSQVLNDETLADKD
jgi:hypothetical protein